MQGDQETLLQEAAGLFRNSDHAIAFTGAGISVPSGFPDFRSPGGIWSKYNPIEVASVQALETNPRGVWEFLLDTSDLIDKVEPNAAHLALAKMEENNLLKGIITQNIDNLHQRAGSFKVIEYHGNFQRFFCHKCGRNFSIEEIRDYIDQYNIPIYCDKCEGLIRPDVVFFGESIPVIAQNESNNLVKNADLAIILGTSGEVEPASILPRKVKMNKGKIIEINLGKTHFSDITDVRFNDSVEKIMPKLADLCLSI